MTCKIIDCKFIAKKIKEQLTTQVAGLKVKPKLCVLLVGDDKASALYVRKKTRSM